MITSTTKSKIAKSTNQNIPRRAEHLVTFFEEVIWKSCRLKQIFGVIIPQEDEQPCIELWDFPVILTFDHDLLSPPPQPACLLT